MVGGATPVLAATPGINAPGAVAVGWACTAEGGGAVPLAGAGNRRRAVSLSATGACWACLCICSCSTFCILAGMSSGGLAIALCNDSCKSTAGPVLAVVSTPLSAKDFSSSPMTLDFVRDSV